jgi:DNA-binding MarR family transcriptional regulator
LAIWIGLIAFHRRAGFGVPDTPIGNLASAVSPLHSHKQSVGSPFDSGAKIGGTVVLRYCEGLLLANSEVLRRSPITKDDHAVLHQCLLLIDAFRAIRRVMPLQHAYTFLFVALAEGRSVSEYAKCAGTTQAVMTRILFALSSRSRGREPGYSLVQQVIDPQDGRRTQTFLTVRGKALVHEIGRLIRSDRQRAMKLRKLMKAENSPRHLENDQWLSRLIEAGRKLGADDIQLEADSGHVEA